MNRLPASKARSEFSDTVNRVAYTKDRVVLHRRGKDVAAIVPMEDLRLLEAMEDASDVRAARKALKERGSVPYEKVRKELGIK